jgi:hypothetical protein
MRRLLIAATAALGLLGSTGPIQAQSFHHVSGGRAGGVHATGFRGSFRGGPGFRGPGFRGFRGRDDALVAGVVGLSVGAALAAPYYYGPGYYYDGPAYGDYDAPAYACGEWRWDPYRQRQVWVNDC